MSPLASTANATQVALEQPTVDGGVVLVRVARDERVDGQRVAPHLEPAGGLELALAGKIDFEDTGAVLNPVHSGGLERSANDVANVADLRLAHWSTTAA